MRLFPAAPLILAATFVGGAARADCIGPFDCLCARTSSTAPVVVATVLLVEDHGDVATVDLRVDAVHGSSTDAGLGPDDTVQVDTVQELRVGERVVVAVGQPGVITPWSIVHERSDGSIACDGFSSSDLTLTDVIEVRQAEDCYSAISKKNATYEFPECNDTVSGPFGCSSAGAPALSWALLGLLGLGVARRHRRG